MNVLRKDLKAYIIYVYNIQPERKRKTQINQFHREKTFQND